MAFLAGFCPNDEIAPFFIVLRVTSRTTSTSDFATRNAGSIRFSLSKGVSAKGNGILLDRGGIRSVDVHEDTPSELGVRSENAFDGVTS